jgi:hypothetical protein
VPLSCPSPYSKRWWSPALNRQCKESQRLARIAHRWRFSPEHPIHAQHRAAQAKYARAIADTKAAHWANWLTNIAGKDLWSVSRLVTGAASDGGHQRMPTLRVIDRTTSQVVWEAVSDKEKSRLLHLLFYPPSCLSQTSLPTQFTLPQPGNSNLS